MSSSEFATFVIQISIMLGCGLLLGQLMRRLKQPAVLGEMLGGIILGPTVAAALIPGWSEWVFPSHGSATLARTGTIKLGMLFFMLTIGLEIELSSLRRNGMSAFLIGTLGSLIPLGAGIGLVYALPGIWGIVDENQRLAYSLFIGCCLANSANPVLARILFDLGLLKERIGAIIMASTIVDDLLSWSLVAVVLGQFSSTSEPSHHSTASHLGLFIITVVGIVAVGHWIALPLLKSLRERLPYPSGFMSVVSILVLVAAAIAEVAGIHAFLGPFLLGIALAPTAEERKEAYGAISQFVMGFFGPIYFVSMGLSCNFLTNYNSVLVFSVLLTACVSKILSSTFAAKLSGLDGSTSLAIGCGMNARGAIGVILAQIGYENKVINEPVYVSLVVMALVTSMMAGPMMQFFIKRAQLKSLVMGSPAASRCGRPV